MLWEEGSYQLTKNNLRGGVSPLIEHMYVYKLLTCLQLPSNQSFYRQIAGYRMDLGDHEVAWWRKEVIGKQNNLMHPN